MLRSPFEQVRTGPRSVFKSGFYEPDTRGQAMSETGPTLPSALVAAMIN
jgi:hypothetical protein